MKKPIYKTLTFWALLIAFISMLFIIFISPYFFDAFKELSFRLLVGLSLFFSPLLIILLLIVFKEEETQEAIIKKQEQYAIKVEYKKVIKTKIKEIRKKFNEAIKLIKKSSLYKYKRDAHYELPWYLVVGETQEGKTTLLNSSGLEFPLNVNYDNKEIVEEQASDSFDWYYSEKSIFIDMPSMYVKQNTNPEDPIIWKEFLRLFTKKRWRRPISGIILTVSVDTLIDKNEKELEQYAKNLRDRFDELSKAFMSSVPIYLIITKSDKIDGFNEYFASLNEDEKDEILGVTFDDKSKNIDSDVIKPELEALLKRLNSSVLEKMQYEWEETNKAKIFLFCENFSNIFEKTNLFVDMCFSQTRYRKPLMLRGIYFTSVPSQTNHYELEDKSTMLDAPRISKGMFIKKLLNDIIFPESQIVVMDENYKKKSKRTQIIAYVLAIASVTIISLFMAKDFIIHNLVLSKMGIGYEQYQEVRDNIRDKNNIIKITNTLNDIDRIIQYQNKNLSDDINKLLFYKIEKRKEDLNRTYLNDLNALLLPKIMKQMEYKLKKDLNNFNKTWNNTKAYVMLENLDEREADYLKEYMAKYWNIRYQNNPDLQNDLNYHWANLLNMGFKVDLSQKSILRVARNRLVKEGSEVLVYNGLKKKFKNTNVKDFSFSQVLGTNVTMFKGTTSVIPGFYTKLGADIFLENGRKLTSEVLKNNWIIGKPMDLNDAEIDKFYSKILSYYFSDYKKYWLNALGNINIRTSNTIVALNNQLSVFSSADSPIISILIALKENTQIYTKAEILKMKANDSLGGAVINATMGSNQITRNTSNSLRKQSQFSNRGIINLRAFFKPYNKLLKKDLSTTVVLDNANASLDKAFQIMTSIYGAVTPQLDAFKIVTSRISGEGERMVVPLTILPRHIKRLYRSTLVLNWRYLVNYSKLYINSVYKKEVLSYYNERLKFKYPIYKKASGEYISLDDFTDFFKEDGILDSFYKNYLSYFVKINSNNRTYSLKNIDGVLMNIDKSFMRSILRAKRIRKIFFKNNGHLGFTASIKPHTLGNNLATMELQYDNNSIYYEHGPIKSQKIVWPPQSLDNTVKFNLYNLNNSPVAVLYKDNEWALFEILDNFKSSVSSNGGILLKFKKPQYDAAFYLKGKIGSVFTQYDSLGRFYLRSEI